MIYLLITLSLFQAIEDEYYTNSAKVASIDVDTLSFEGDELYWACNWISRANYKLTNYKKAYDIAYSCIDEDDIKQDALYYDVISLKALVAKNVSKFEKADSLYKLSISITPDSLSKILYRSHLNYAELQRLQMNYDNRKHHLLKALSYSEGWERNKVIRVLARHYFNVLLEFDNAQKILSQHDPYEELTDEGKAGYLLVQAQYAEALKKYKDAKRYYAKAQKVARKAGFISFQLTAVDGAMKSEMLLKEQEKNDRRFMYINVGILVIILVLLAWKEILRRRYE
jgi:hypothetical protein